MYLMYWGRRVQCYPQNYPFDRERKAKFCLDRNFAECYPQCTRKPVEMFNTNYDHIIFWFFSSAAFRDALTCYLNASKTSKTSINPALTARIKLMQAQMNAMPPPHMQNKWVCLFKFDCYFGLNLSWVDNYVSGIASGMAHVIRLCVSITYWITLAAPFICCKLLFIDPLLISTWTCSVMGTAWTRCCFFKPPTLIDCWCLLSVNIDNEKSWNSNKLNMETD